MIQTLVNPRVWHLGWIGFTSGFGTYIFSFWLPQMMRSLLTGRSNTVVGLAVMMPNVVGLIAMIVASRHSDRSWRGVTTWQHRWP